MKQKSDSTKLEHLRHSMAHLLAAAVLELWPDAKLAIGPAIKEGFYYDIEFKKPISDRDLTKIENKMHQIVKKWQSFSKIEIPYAEAKKKYRRNPYKRELIDEYYKKREKVRFFRSGNFIDLCRGGHTSRPSIELKHFKLLSVAGAYWRGNEKNKMLTRIYGTVFPTKKELENYLLALEKAKINDHRKLGKELELFTINENIGPGLVLWLPKGNIIKEELENWAKETEKKWGYQRVTTPHITKSGLYFTSGHLPYYQDEMFPPMKIDSGEEYYLKPMNCPHHHMIFSSKIRSYRELPLRLAEYGKCYRYEASGELFGLLRVRGIDQNDAHIYCTREQAVDEFVDVMKLHEYYYKTLGIKNYHLELSLRDPNNKKKYHGDAKMWELAEKLMRQAVRKINIPMVEEEGSAAFYGPKIDFIIHSKIGREFAISTNQIDLYMGGRFDMSYIDKSGASQTPVIIHRAPLGAHERFIGFLIEHFEGAFPTWLAPIQVAVLPISNKVSRYADQVSQELNNHNIRVFKDESDSTISRKIRDSENQKIPYLMIVGEREQKNQVVALRSRDLRDAGTMKLNNFIEKITREIKSKSLRLSVR